MAQAPPSCSFSKDRDPLTPATSLTVAEVYLIQYRLIEMFGGCHGVRDKGAIEAAVFRPQTGYYNSIEEEAAALMESLGNNHGFLDGNKPIALTAADVFLRRNGFYIEVEGLEGHAFIVGSMDRHEFRLPKSSSGSVSTSSPWFKLVLFIPYSLRGVWRAGKSGKFTACSTVVSAATSA